MFHRFLNEGPAEAGHYMDPVRLKPDTTWTRRTLGLDAEAARGVQPAPPGIGRGQTSVPATNVRTTRKSRSSTTRSAWTPSAILPRSPSPSCRAGVVEHMSAAATTDCLNVVTTFRNARS